MTSSEIILERFIQYAFTIRRYSKIFKNVNLIFFSRSPSQDKRLFSLLYYNHFKEKFNYNYFQFKSDVNTNLKGKGFSELVCLKKYSDYIKPGELVLKVTGRYFHLFPLYHYHRLLDSINIHNKSFFCYLHPYRNFIDTSFFIFKKRFFEEFDGIDDIDDTKNNYVEYVLYKFISKDYIYYKKHILLILLSNFKLRYGFFDFFKTTLIFLTTIILFK